ncbi:hypothetical protein [Rhizobium rhizogenes]|uniref:hypothetical protein n=1 Tax=Rhizobium rhizogenes TaxID=359 RepID=UPI001572722D|nr:hypothetical protein [Rhizobium rhizogenes]NTF41552.1 hypothetical protein [Rhizobium rhizogenes]
MNALVIVKAPERPNGNVVGINVRVAQGQYDQRHLLGILRRAVQANEKAASKDAALTTIAAGRADY